MFWNATQHWQAEDRIHRIGQVNPVSSYYLILKDSAEMDTVEILDQKAEMFSQVVDGKKLEEFDLLKALMQKYKGSV